MKYTERNRKRYNGSPYPWIETQMDHAGAIQEYYNKHIVVYDCDTCGDDIYIFKFNDGKVFKFYHSYQWEIDDDGNYDHVDNIFMEISKENEGHYVSKYDDLSVPSWMNKERDWI